MLEKQLTGHRVDRSICDWFWNQAISQGDSFKVPKWLFRYILVHFGTFEILGLISNLLIIPTYLLRCEFYILFDVSFNSNNRLLLHQRIISSKFFVRGSLF